MNLGFAASPSSDGVFLCICSEEGDMTPEQQMFVSSIVERLAGVEHTENIWQVEKYSLGSIESLMEDRGLEYGDTAQVFLEWAKEDGYFQEEDDDDDDNDYELSMESESYHDMDDY